MKGTHRPKADVKKLYIKRRNGGSRFFELESAHNIAIVGLNEYTEQGEDRLTRLLQEYSAG